MNDVIYSRNCPKCGKVLTTKNKYWNIKAVHENRLCGSCGLKGKPKSDEHKQRMSENHADVNGENNPFYKKKHSAKTIKQLSANQVERMKDDEYRKKLSDAMIEYHKHNDNAFKGKTHSDETKSLMRLSLIDRISMSKFNGNQFYPNYNINSIPIIEQKAKELGITDLQHAENGGEYYIKELGYWVDGYSNEKNIVIEYDEKRHFKNGKLRDKDIKRQTEIEEFLKCKFIRITQMK